MGIGKLHDAQLVILKVDQGLWSNTDAKPQFGALSKYFSFHGPFHPQSCQLWWILSSCHTEITREFCGQFDPFGTAFYRIPPVFSGPSLGNFYFDELPNSPYNFIPISFHHSLPPYFHRKKVLDFCS